MAVRTFETNCGWLGAIALSGVVPAGVVALSFFFLKASIATSLTAGFGLAGALAGSCLFSVQSAQVRTGGAEPVVPEYKALRHVAAVDEK